MPKDKRGHDNIRRWNANGDEYVGLAMLMMLETYGNNAIIVMTVTIRISVMVLELTFFITRVMEMITVIIMLMLLNIAIRVKSVKTIKIQITTI